MSAARRVPIVATLVVFTVLVLSASVPMSGPPSTQYLGPLITARNNQIQLLHFSIVAPPDQGWRLVWRPMTQIADSYGLKKGDPEGKAAEVADVAMELGPPAPALFLMRFLPVQVFGDMRSRPARQVADAFRSRPRQPDRADHRTIGLQSGEETIGGRTFYTMKYRIAAGNYAQTSEIYLWFPSPAGNEYFLLAHYSESTPPNAAPPRSYRPEFLDVLKTLRVKS